MSLDEWFLQETFIKALLQIPIQIPEHGAVLHVMPVDDEVCPGVKVSLLPHIETAVLTVISVKIAVQIVFVIPVLHDRIINLHALYG